MTDEFAPEQIYLHNRLLLTGVVVLYYDYFLTLGDEITHVWRVRKTASVWLFFVNRYYPLLIGIILCSANFANFKTTKSCFQYGDFRDIALFATEIIVTVISLLRTYALYDRSKKVLALLVSSAVILTGVAFWATAGEHSDVSISLGCNFAHGRLTGIHAAGSWEALFVFDCLVFVLTIWRTYRVVRPRFYTMMGSVDGLMELIFRDGAVYFGGMALAQAANMTSFFVLSDVNRGALNTFACSISATMMSRAMLNMRKSVHRPQSNTDISSSDDTDTLKWDSFFVHANAGGTSVDGTTMSGNGGEDLIEVDENEVSVDLDLGFNGANRVGSDDDDYNGEMRSVEGENRDGGLDIASAV